MFRGWCTIFAIYFTCATSLRDCSLITQSRLSQRNGTQVVGLIYTKQVIYQVCPMRHSKHVRTLYHTFEIKRFLPFFSNSFYQIIRLQNLLQRCLQDLLIVSRCLIDPDNAQKLVPVHRYGRLVQLLAIALARTQFTQDKVSLINITLEVLALYGKKN